MNSDNQVVTQEEIKEKEFEMRTALKHTQQQFENYKNEFEKLSGICDAFESEAKRLAAQVDVYKQLAQRSKQLVESGNIEALQRLYVSVML